MAEGREGLGDREWKPGKATEFDEAMAGRTLTQEEMDEWRGGKRPELRLRSDAPSVEVDEATHAQEAIDKLRDGDISGLALRNSEGVVAAMMVPVERYLELVSAELASDPFNKEAHLDGRITPTEAAFAASSVEQVDPHATWVYTGGRKPG